jgi:two-component system, chemotaxis family, response regulator Rcp1
MTDTMRILLVEDNPADCELMEEVLAEARLPHRLRVCRDGAEALALLQSEARDRRKRPDLILLDLNMPRMDGREFLAARKADPELLEIPVIVLTTSGADDDIRASYRLNANAYVTKAIEFSQFAATAKRITEFWAGVAALPTKV